MTVFLDYLYKDILPTSMDSDLISELFYLSDKYNVAKLKLEVGRLACSIMNSENAVLFLIIADRHSFTQVEEAALNHLSKQMADVMSTESWKEMVKAWPQLMEKIISKMVALDKTSTTATPGS